MADKYHINPATGRPGKCRATHKCRFGGEDNHYATREAAQAAFEREQEREQAFATLAKVTSSSHKSVMQQELAALMVAREEALELQYSSFERVRGRLGGYTWKLAIPREAYESRKENAEYLTRQADEKARELRAFKTVPRWKSDFPQAKNLEQARSEVMHSLNKSGDKEFFSPNMDVYVQETLDRYHDGETIEDKVPLPSDRLLKVLTVEDNGLMSQQQVYNVLVFPEKDLKPVLDRLGIDQVEISPLVNGRENGLVYTVRDPYGETRSFVIYEDRNSDSLIINGRENWDPTNKDDPLPYAGTTKHEFFAEFGPGDFKQAAETTGYFLKSAQKGILESDRELVQKCSRRDWKAILSEQIPGYAEWAAQRDEEEKEKP